jgi:hypothetical protein
LSARKATDCLDEVIEFLRQHKKVNLAGDALIAPINIPGRHLWVDNVEAFADSFKYSESIDAFHLLAFGLEKLFRSLLVGVWPG